MADATDLKSVLAKSEVWVQIPSSAPLKTQFSRNFCVGEPAIGVCIRYARVITISAKIRVNIVETAVTTAHVRSIRLRRQRECCASENSDAREKDAGQM